MNIDINQSKNEETTKLRYITPILEQKWPRDKILMEYEFTDGRISVDEYNDTHRGKRLKADYILLYKDNIPLAIVEAKGAEHTADKGYNQAVNYATILDVPFAYATNGTDLVERDMLTGLNTTLKIENFPTSDELWARYKRETNMNDFVEDLYKYPYYTSSTGKTPRYYQRIAINRTINAIANGQKRILIQMATGTGKTFVSFQIIHRFWKTRTFKKILYLADRNILIDQTMRKDFKPFLDAMEKLDHNNINTSKDIYLGLYHQLKSGENDYYKQFSPDFFDLIVIDECHKSSRKEADEGETNWHDILTYFNSAVQIGMTATPNDGGLEEAQNDYEDCQEAYNIAVANGVKEDIEKCKKDFEKANDNLEKAQAQSNIQYFGNAIFCYSLKSGIADGFLAPYRVVTVELDIDKLGWTPDEDTLDVNGNPVVRRQYTCKDFDRIIVSPERRKTVAKRISDFLKENNMRYEKTIVFCEDTKHCEAMVRLLENENADLVKEDPRYVMQITGDNQIGKQQLDNFIDPSSKYPVIAVTSKLLSTGVDAETCKLVVLDKTIGSMTEFKQIIGRGTRIKKEYTIDRKKNTKQYFTILDFRRNYLKFTDPAFDGDPVRIDLIGETDAFPKPPLKPGNNDFVTTRNTSKKQYHVVCVNGIEYKIENSTETVYHIDENGKLVSENLTSCIHNNIVMQYPTINDFRKAFLDSTDKAAFASDLLLHIDWENNFKKHYGYAVDVYDIIMKMGYDIEPPMSKVDRIHKQEVVDFVNTFDDPTKTLLNMLLETYVESDLRSLIEVKDVFSLPKFNDLGFTPLSAVKAFGGKSNYIKTITELEKHLY